MYFLAAMAVLTAALTVVAVAKHMRMLHEQRPQHRPLRDPRPIDRAFAESNYVDGELICRPGYLYLTLTCVTETDEKDYEVFVGYAKTDAGHDGRVVVCNAANERIGWISGQRQLYGWLLTVRRSPLYGVVSYSPERGGRGEVCVRVDTGDPK